jgi:enoyl-CoA hydratase/carnithine racemase
MGTTVQYERQGIIGYIVLNRPHVLNAMNDEWLYDLLAAAEQARADNEARVIVVRGEGRAFCAGADLKESAVRRELAEYRDHHMRPQQDIARVFRRMGKPVIAQVHGYAVGGGCELALLADIRIAAEGSQFGFPEVRVGATVTLGGVYNLSRIVGAGKAFELLYTTDFIDAREAERIGLVNRVVPLEQLPLTVTALAEKIARHYPLELSLTRASVYHALDTDFESALREEDDASVISYAAGTRAEGMTVAFAQLHERKRQ